MDWLNFLLAFIEGLALILSPCILPILPIVLSAGITGGKKRPIGIMLGFSVTFALFTLFSRFLVQHLGINLDLLRDASFILIICFGCILLSNKLSERFSQLTQKIASIGASSRFNAQPQEGFFSGVLVGALISLIWTPCAGPILAAVLLQIAVQKTVFASFITLVMFSLGSIIPMMIIAFAGKKIFQKINVLKQKTELLRKLFGCIIILTTLILMYISHFRPEIFAALAIPKTKENTSHTAGITPLPAGLIDEIKQPYVAPPLAGISAWINSAPLKLENLKGKVILIDFWTYSCINCIRTLPYLRDWDALYRDKGLYIIGVHTPEFEFEKNVNNVQQAVKHFNIKYPVVLDNDYATWSNYNNSYWPAHYLIDKNGKVVYEHFGEGDDDITEHNIRVLLGLNPSTKNLKSVGSAINENQTPETYLGYDRSENFANLGPAIKDSVMNFTFPEKLNANEWALQGQWLIQGQKIITKQQGAEIKLHFNASHVYVVIGNAEGAHDSRVKVLLNGQPIAKVFQGADIKDGALMITDQRLYEIAQFEQPTEGEVTLIIEDGSVELYTFTFG